MRLRRLREWKDVRSIVIYRGCGLQFGVTLGGWIAVGRASRSFSFAGAFH